MVFLSVCPSLSVFVSDGLCTHPYDSHSSAVKQAILFQIFPPNRHRPTRWDAGDSHLSARAQKLPRCFYLSSVGVFLSTRELCCGREKVCVCVCTERDDQHRSYKKFCACEEENCRAGQAMPSQAQNRVCSPGAILLQQHAIQLDQIKVSKKQTEPNQTKKGTSHKGESENWQSDIFFPFVGACFITTLSYSLYRLKERVWSVILEKKKKSSDRIRKAYKSWCRTASRLESSHADS